MNCCDELTLIHKMHCTPLDFKSMRLEGTAWYSLHWSTDMLHVVSLDQKKHNVDISSQTVILEYHLVT